MMPPIKPYYSHSGIRIYVGDNRTILPRLGKVDMVFTSPPYNLGWNKGGYGAKQKVDIHSKSLQRKMKERWKGGAGSDIIGDGYEGYADNLPPEEYLKWQHSLLNELWRHLNEDGAIYYNHKPRHQNGEVTLPTIYNPGLPLRQIIIWHRNIGVNISASHYRPVHEWILLLAKPAFHLRDISASGVNDVWSITPRPVKGHPAPFPVELAARAIETTNAKIILDPFCGSGSTLVAAKQLSREAIGIELSIEYADIAINRLKQEILL